MEIWMLILILLLTAFLSALLAALVIYRKMHRKLSFMLDALEDGETAFRYREGKWFSLFNRTLNRLRAIFDAEIKAMREQDVHYGRMLDAIPTGIMVIDSTERGQGNVLYTNASASHILGLGALSHIRQLAAISPEFLEAFQSVMSNKEVRTSLSNERTKVMLSLTATDSTVRGKAVRIISINDITGDLAHSEEVSWNKLIRVLTHEIMNTVTPIASLSDTLSSDLKKSLSDRSALDIEEVRNGLDTISSSSKGLIKFVDTYRHLTRVSTPVKKAFYVRELVDRVRVLTEEKVREAGARFYYEEKSEDVLIYADAGQISQILVNLVKNAIQAGASVLRIEASIDFNEKVIIRVSNNGRPIPEEARDEVFVPFYTTRKDGSGIGLSLSRQIMRLHNGTISLERSDANMTTFVMEFR